MEVASALTDERGRFLLTAPVAGTYSLRAQRIGFADTNTGGLKLTAGATRDIRMASTSKAVALEGIVATGKRRCKLEPESADRTFALWEEARKALEAAKLADRKRLVRYDVVEYERELDPHQLAVRSEQRKPRTEYARHPFGSKLTAEQLSQGGFIQERSGQLYYYAPDADVLLSSVFQGDHCFHAEAGDSLVGLAFEPAHDRDVPEIEGVMWLDPHSAELRRVDFRYTKLPWNVSREAVGGRLEVERLVSGLHIISRWRIRMPVVELQDRKESRLPGGRIAFQEARLVGIDEKGGIVGGVVAGDGAKEFAARTATLAGVAWDSAGGGPLAGAKIALLGTQHVIETGADGSFRANGLPDGTYFVSVSHPKLDSLGIVPPLRPIELNPGETTRMAFAVPARLARAPSAAAGGIHVAGRTVGRGSTATIEGTVVNTDGQPIAGAQAAIVLDASVGREVGVVSDDSGHFALPGVPSGKRVLAVRQIGYDARSISLDLAAGEFVRVDATLPIHPVSIAGLSVVSSRPGHVRTIAEHFEDRRRRGVGFFIDRTMIEARHPASISEMLVAAPGVKRECNYSVDVSHACMVRFAGARQTVGMQDPMRGLQVNARKDSLFTPEGVGRAGGGFTKPGTFLMDAKTGCPVQYYVDGLPFPIDDQFNAIDLQISMVDVQSIEVYQPGEVPAQFSGGRNTRCGVVVIWTGRARPGAAGSAAGSGGGA